jgi:tRNA(Ile)-lysidine synthase
MDDDGFLDRVARSLAASGVDAATRHLLVAFSGGLDSTVLLHVLRFGLPQLRLTLTAAHLDHAMRDTSPADAAWVRGICRAWDVPLEHEIADPVPRNEREARDARYAFLASAAARAGAERIVTAHHADDQAETVLFRAIRGTGLAGLGGIPRRTASGVIRPLLPFWREELEAYAAAARLVWRTDPTNATHSAARNRIRLSILPLVEREVNASARRNLVALASLARESEAGWRTVVDGVYPDIVSEEENGLTVDRHGLGGYHPAIGTRILRRALRRFGIVLDRAGTRSALKFITDAPSGREMHLPGGVRISTEFTRARIGSGSAAADDVPLSIESLEPGEGLDGEVVVGGRRYRVGGRLVADPSEVPRPGSGWAARIEVEPAQFPLLLRGRRPGDRVRTPTGSRSVKRLMIDRRVPLSERTRRPILVDGSGAVLWIAGLDRVATSIRRPGTFALDLTITDG